jgi:anti-sigma regulatory factor (Ser/Thr protein kinase)
MATVRDRGEAVRKFILAHVEKHPTDIVKVAVARFKCSRQAIHKHLHRLVEDGSILMEGEQRKRTYRLAPPVVWKKAYELRPGLTEDRVWRDDVAPALGHLPANAMDIWQYGFTEMFNNAIDHSEGTIVTVVVEKSATTTRILLLDDGVGIFRKIQVAMDLADPRHSVLELAKGKFTTDPKNHSGEGIFFSSRMFDRFVILSHGVHFSHEFGEDGDWILEFGEVGEGTCVMMTLNNHTSRTMRRVFGQFSSGDDRGFNKTIVPVEMATYGDDNLVSRSQAKRLLTRIDRFKVVVLDFSGVKIIGQAFADEVFRVFANRHPSIEIKVIRANAAVQQMISRVLSTQ